MAISNLILPSIILLTFLQNTEVSGLIFRFLRNRHRHHYHHHNHHDHDEKVYWNARDGYHTHHSYTRPHNSYGYGHHYGGWNHRGSGGIHLHRHHHRSWTNPGELVVSRDHFDDFSTGVFTRNGKSILDKTEMDPQGIFTDPLELFDESDIAPEFHINFVGIDRFGGVFYTISTSNGESDKETEDEMYLELCTRGTICDGPHTRSAGKLLVPVKSEESYRGIYTWGPNENFTNSEIGFRQNTYLFHGKSTERFDLWQFIPVSQGNPDENTNMETKQGDVPDESFYIKSANYNCLLKHGSSEDNGSDGFGGVSGGVYCVIPAATTDFTQVKTDYQWRLADLRNDGDEQEQK